MTLSLAMDFGSNPADWKNRLVLDTYDDFAFSYQVVSVSLLIIAPFSSCLHLNIYFAASISCLMFIGVSSASVRIASVGVVLRAPRQILSLLACTLCILFFCVSEADPTTSAP